MMPMMTRSGQWSVRVFSRAEKSQETKEAEAFAMMTRLLLLLLLLSMSTMKTNCWCSSQQAVRQAGY